MNNNLTNITTLVFFISSIFLSYLFVQEDDVFESLNGVTILDYEDIDDLTCYDQKVIHAYNKDYLISYSLNGGDKFTSAAKSLDISKVNCPEMAMYPTGIKWKSPHYSLPKIKSVRLSLKNHKSGKQTHEKVITDLNEFNSSIPIISLNCKASELFDQKNGIMVPGKNNWKNDRFYSTWYSMPGNYTLRGKPNEISANLQYFDKDSLYYESNVGIRISGNATRSFPQKSLRVTSKNEQSFNFFNGEKIKWKSIVLRNSGNDNSKTMFADLIMQDLAKNTKVLTQRGHPVHIFINGNYWGIYNLRERVSKHFISQIEGVKEKKITILENGNAELKSGNPAIQQVFINRVQGWLDKDQLTTSDLNSIGEFLSINSFIDYFFFETYFANSDWPSNNMLWYKPSKKKWKWILNDLDCSLAFSSEKNVETNMFELTQKSKSICSQLFTKLLIHPDFKSKFIKRANAHIKNTLSEEHLTKMFNNYESTYSKEIELQIKRWRISPSVRSWRENIADNLAFLRLRNTIYIKHLRDL